MTQVLGGHAQLAYCSGAYYPQAKAGKIAVLAVLAEQRRRRPGRADAEGTRLRLSSVNLILSCRAEGTAGEVRAQGADKTDDAFADADADPPIVALMAESQPQHLRRDGRRAREDHPRPESKVHQQLIEAAK